MSKEGANSTLYSLFEFNLMEGFQVKSVLNTALLNEWMKCICSVFHSISNRTSYGKHSRNSVSTAAH